jgi:hypothetical protein
MYAVGGVGDSTHWGNVMSDQEVPVVEAEVSPTEMPTGVPFGAASVAAKPRRFVPWLLAAAVLVVVGVAGALAWVNYTRSPEYSLGQMASAAQNKDWDGVQKYMDVDAVTSNLVDVAMSQALTKDTTGLGALGAGLAQAMKPALTQQLKDTLRKSVEDATSTATGGISGVLRAKSPKSVTYVTKTEVLVTLKMPDKTGGTQDMKLRMKWADDHWRVTAFENAVDLLGSPN